MYFFINSTAGSTLTKETPVAKSETFRFNINMQYAVVYITLTENEQTLETLTLLFENGTEISNATISNKIFEEYKVNITLNEEINETASYTDRYYISAGISQAESE